jgi:hypothetical protein
MHTRHPDKIKTRLAKRLSAMSPSVVLAVSHPESERCARKRENFPRSRKLSQSENTCRICPQKIRTSAREYGEMAQISSVTSS